MAVSSPSYLCQLLFTISCLIRMVQSETHIIHMDIFAMPKVFADHPSWYAATLCSLSNLNPGLSTPPKILYTYNSVTHGFSAILSPSELAILQKSPGFVYSIPDVPLKAHSTYTSEFLGLNSNFGAWPESGYGKDVIIGVVDGGVWPESESFQDHGMAEIPARWKGKCVSDIAFNSSMCNKKLIGARFYNKGLIASPTYRRNITGSRNSTRDIEGHGTHTASIAAGNYVRNASFFGYGHGTAKGMAPLAHLAIYKVLWEDDASTSDVIAAIDQAIDDGVNVLSISMGWSGDWFPLYLDPIAIASHAAMQKGIFVATSAGNAGPRVYSVENGAPWILTVGAGSVDRSFGGTVSLGNGVSVFGDSLYSKKLNFSRTSLPLVYMHYCQDPDKLREIGYKIVVCDGGIEKNQVFYALYAQLAGAIFIGTTLHMEELLDQTTLPAIFVSPQVGQPILDYINQSSSPKASLEFHKTRIGGYIPAPAVPQYSARGPSLANLGVLKPDLIAPGTMILASWSPVSQILRTTGTQGSEVVFSPFNILYGTSMACPHAAGVAALLKGKHPEWSPAAIRSAMMTTADPLDNTGKIIKNAALLPANPLDIGAGHIKPNKALYPGLVYDANTDDYMRFLCSMNYTINQIKMITRSSPLNCSNPSSDINYPSFISFFNSTASSKTNITYEFQRTVTNVGDGTSTYKAKLTHMDEIQVSVIPNTLVFKHKYEKLRFILTIKGPARLKNDYVDGSLSWMDDKGKYVVRSPIMATRVNSYGL